MTQNLSGDLKDCIAFHGHLCPGLTIGYLASKIALKKIQWRRAEDEELICVTMSVGCGVDAVQLMTGCTLGKGNLIFQDYGKMVFIFLRRKHDKLEKGLRLSFQPPSSMKMMKRSKHTSREKVSSSLLAIPIEKLFNVRYVKDYPLPERAKIFPSQKCSVCGELTMEPRLRVCAGKLLCPECAPQGYVGGWS